MGELEKCNDDALSLLKLIKLSR